MAECIVVVPCFNEAQRLDARAFVQRAARHDEDFIFVNDGSSDETGPLLDDLCAANSAGLSALHLRGNRGKAEAVRRGILQALSRRPKYVGYWDADLATPLDALGDFVDYLDAHPRAEILLGARVRLLGRTIDRSPGRHYAGRLFAAAAGWVLRLPVYDTQCGAKLMRVTDRVERLFAEPFRTRWIFDVELLARYMQSVAQSGDESPQDLIHELPLTAWRDVAGSKLRAGDFFRAAAQLLDIYRRYRIVPRPRMSVDAHHAASDATHASSRAGDLAKEPVGELESVP